MRRVDVPGYTSIGMNLSQKASEVARVLTVAGNGAPMGKVAAIDPDSGEYYVGDTVAEAVRNARGTASRTPRPSSLWSALVRPLVMP